MMMKGFQSRFKQFKVVVVDLFICIYTYINTDIPSRAITRRIVVFEQIELGLQADEPH